MYVLRHTLHIAACLTLLTACGGGGSGGGTPFSVSYGTIMDAPEGAVVALNGVTQGNSGAVNYAWQQLSGPPVTLSSITAKAPTFTSMDIPANATATTLVFRVTATDGIGNVAMDDLTVNVHSADYVVYVRSLGIFSGELWSFEPGTATHRRLSLVEDPDINTTIGSWVWSVDRTAAIHFRNHALEPQLYRGRVDGSALHTLSPIPTAMPGSIHNWRESPVGGMIGYRGLIEHATSEELYVVDANGTGRRTLLPAIAGWQDISEFEWLPDGSRILARGELHQVGIIDIVSILPDGTGRVQVNKSMVAGGRVQSYELSPDSTTIAYMGDADTDDIFELYVASTTGGASTKLNAPLVAGGGVLTHSWSPDGTRILYYADEDIDELRELYSVNPDGTGHIKLNVPLGVGQALTGFGWINGGSRFLYSSDEETLGFEEAYTVLQDGTGRVKLNGAMIGTGDVQMVMPIQGQDKVFFTADDATDGVNELFVVDSDGMNRNRITTGTMGPGATGVDEVETHGATFRIVYTADEDANGDLELYTTSLTGAGRTKLNAAMAMNADVESFKISPTGSHVAYIADALVDGQMEVFCVRVGGSQHTHLTASVPVTSTSSPQVEWSADGTFLSIHGRYETGNDLGTYVVEPDGTSFVRILDGAPAGTITSSVAWSLTAD